jgi:putative FmdB family regulatory protein
MIESDEGNDMPFYEYQCKQCGHALEAMQKVNDAPLKKCPECGKSALQRLMSAPVFRLKGGGWYETDFKSDQEGKRNLADRPESDTSATATKEAGATDAAGGKESAGKESASKEPAAKEGTGAKAEPKPAAPSANAAKKPAAGSRAAAPPARAARKPPARAVPSRPKPRKTATKRKLKR